MPDGGRFTLKYCKSCHRSDVRFPSKTAPRCTGCTNLHNGARAERLSILRPSPIAVDPEPAGEPRQNETHLRWVRKMTCAVRNPDCHGPTQAHHVRENSGAGTGLKPGSEWTVPLCEFHHMVGHTRGWVTFQMEHGIDLRALSIRLAEASPHIGKGQG